MRMRDERSSADADEHAHLVEAKNDRASLSRLPPALLEESLSGLVVALATVPTSIAYAKVAGVPEDVDVAKKSRCNVFCRLDL